MERPKVVFDYSSLKKKEDWWACWIGFFILLTLLIAWLLLGGVLFDVPTF